MAFQFVIWFSFWGLLIDKISGEQWVYIVIFCIGIFSGANVTQKIKMPNAIINSKSQIEDSEKEKK